MQSHDLGLLAEEYNIPGKHLAGNFPQALTHFAVVNTALSLCGPTLQRATADPRTIGTSESAMSSADHYDVIVIGSGPGGGALAQRLAPTGKRILMSPITSRLA